MNAAGEGSGWRPGPGPVSASSRSTKIAPGRCPASYFTRPCAGLAEDPADVDNPEIRVRQAGGKILGRDQGHAGSVAHRRAWVRRGPRAILSAGATPRRRAPDRLPVPPLRRSSVVERAAVNRLVVGSSPTAGATFVNEWPYFGLLRTTLDDPVRGFRDCHGDCQVRAGRDPVEEVGGEPLLGGRDVVIARARPGPTG